MLDLIQIHSEKEDLRKPAEYETFLLWLSIPSLMRFPPKDRRGRQQTGPEFAESIGIEDENILFLVSLTTQNDFAEHFNVSKDTLSLWKKRAAKQGTINTIKQWADPMTKNVIMALYTEVMKGGQSQHFKLWLQVVNDWTEKIKIDTTYRGVATINVMTKKVAEPDAAPLQTNDRPIINLRKRN